MEERLFNIGDRVSHETNSNVIMRIVKFNWDRKFFERDSHFDYTEKIEKNVDPSTPELRNKKRLQYKCQWVTNNGKVKQRWFKENVLCNS